MRIYMIAASLLLLLAGSVYAQAGDNPVTASQTQALADARERAHQHADKLDHMTEDQWLAHKVAHPGRNNAQTLAQARMQAHRHEGKLAYMTPAQYDAEKRRHPKLGEPYTPPAEPQ